MLPEICGSFGATGFVNCFWYLPNLVFALNVKAARIGKPLLFWLRVEYAPRIGCAFLLKLECRSDADTTRRLTSGVSALTAHLS
jgi:hypothetical protein